MKTGRKDIFMDVERAIVYYKGPFTTETLINASDFLRQDIANIPRTGSRIFSIFVELAQNISRYSLEYNHFGVQNREGVGVFAIYQEEGNYVLKAGNLINQEKAKEVLERCQALNELDIKGLKALRKEINSKPRDQQSSKGGNIGLIQIALKSGNPLEVEILESSQPGLVYFIISTVVSEV